MSRPVAVRVLACTGLVLCMLTLGSAGEAADAHVSSLVTDPTGGVSPEAIFCPSTGGGCFTSRQAAVSAMRTATPDVGHLLVPEPRTNSNSVIYFRVPDQSPVSYGPSLYGMDWGGSIKGNGYCPQSLATEDRPTAGGQSYCHDEAEMIAGFIDYRKSCGWNRCTYRDYSVVGGYVNPFINVSASQYIRWITSTTHIKVNTPQEGWLEHGREGKAIQFVEDNHTTGESRTRTAKMLKIQRFRCPDGMRPISTTDVARNPRLCHSTARPYVQIKILRQTRSCPVNAHPCHPSSGDKSRAETDFSFAGRPFVRHYHSLREISPAGFQMGEGWTHSYASQMLGPNRTRQIVASDGTWAPYVSRGNGRWVVPGLGNANLDPMPDGSWILIEPGGDTSTFVAGRLTQIRTPGAPERDVDLEYSAAGQLMRLVDGAGRAVVFTYDASNLLRQVAEPNGTVHHYIYDVSGNLVEVASSAGGRKQYLYGEPGLATNGDPGLLTGIIYEDGNRYASFGYDIHGRVVFSTLHGEAGQLAETTRVHYDSVNSAQVTVSSGAVRRYTYTNDFHRKPLSVSDSSGTTTYAYNVHGQVTSTTDARGAVTRYGYTDLRLSSVSYASGTSSQRTVQTDWNTRFNQPAERRTLNAAGDLVRRSNWTYNDRGQVIALTDTDPDTGLTRTTINTYCEQDDVAVGICPRIGLLISVDGARTDVADITRFTYRDQDHPGCRSSPSACLYRKGDLWKVTNALGHVTETLSYDGAGRPTSVRDANGLVTETTYHPRGWVTSRIEKGGTAAEDRITLIDYWPNGLVKRVTLSEGSYIQYTYDAARRLTGIADSVGNTIHYTLDSAGNRTRETTRNPSGALTRLLSRAYNQLGEITSQSDAYGHDVAYTYDANGNMNAVVDALGRATGNAYDPLDRLTYTLQDVGGIAAGTHFQYDALDNLTRVTDPNGLRTDYTYNGLGDLIQLSSPDTGITTYTYDSAGNRIGQVDARGKAQVSTYDELNRITGISGPARSYRYDDNNATLCPPGERFATRRLSGFSDSSGSTTYCYSRFGQVVRKMQITSGRMLMVRYGYDTAGRLTAMHYPDGAVADYVRDGEGRITEVGVTLVGGVRQIVLTGAGYSPFGPTTGWMYGNGRVLARTFDRNYQPRSIYDPEEGGLSLGFQFDPVGNLIQLESATHATVLAQYGYDRLDRLQQTRRGASGTSVRTYSYDAVGNRTSVQSEGVATSYGYHSGSHRLERVGAETRAYDAAGNTTSIGGAARQFAYDDSGRMIQVKTGSTVTGQFAYNANGEQVRARASVEDTYFIYDEAGHLLGEFDSAGAPVVQIIWLDDLPVGLLSGAAGRQLLHYIEPDHLGTPRVIIDGARNVAVWSWDIQGDAFGASPPDQDPDGDRTSFVFNLRYPGQRYDAASGLNYNYFRDGYEPGTGRYTQSDPIGLKGGVSTYGYAAQSPTNAIDPSGLAAYLVSLPPGNQMPAGSIYCVDGVIRPYFNYSLWPKDFQECKEVRDCLAVHEWSHVADANRTSPGLCRRGPLQFLGIGNPPQSVTFSSDPYPGSPYSELDASEFRAHTVELYCLMAKLKSMTGQCDEKCKAAVIRRIGQITHGSLPAIRDGTYGQ